MSLTQYTEYQNLKLRTAKSRMAIMEFFSPSKLRFILKQVASENDLALFQVLIFEVTK